MQEADKAKGLPDQVKFFMMGCEILDVSGERAFVSLFTELERAQGWCGGCAPNQDLYQRRPIHRANSQFTGPFV